MSNTLVLDVRVIPRAKRSQLGGERDGRMVVRIAAPPVDDAANEALITFLATHFHVPRNRVRIIAGEHRRDKRVEIITP